MAKMKNKKNFNRESSMSNRSASAQGERGQSAGAGVDSQAESQDDSSDSEDESDTEETNYQAAGSRQSRSNTPARSNGGRQQGSSSKKSLADIDPGQLLDSARGFIEGHPGRATLIGALVGGAIAGLFATERGRELVASAYSYARPMIADYARDFINAQSEKPSTPLFRNSLDYLASYFRWTACPEPGPSLES